MRFPHLQFDVRWRPFELNPNLPKGQGLDKLMYYESKFGKARVQGMIPQMKAVAEEYGIQMEYGGYVGNTLDSHVRDFISALENLILGSCFSASFIVFSNLSFFTI